MFYRGARFAYEEPEAAMFPDTLRATTVPQLLDAAAATWPDATYVEGDGRSLTFAEMRDEARRIARALLACGVEQGDRVAIWAPNCWQWIVAGLATHLVGAAIVPLNTRYRGEEAAHIIERSRARVLFTVEGFLGNSYLSMLRDARGGAGEERPVRDISTLERAVILRGDAAGGALSWGELAQLAEKWDEADLDTRIDKLSGDDLSDILFTSGTTGAPKGVMTTHEQNLRVYWSWSEVVGLRAGDRYLIVNPFFHAFGYKAGWLACLMRGATVLPHPVFDAAAVLERIERENVTVLPGPPALFQSLMNLPDFNATRTSTLRMAVTGAASIPVSLIESMFRDLSMETVLTAYGLTEVCGVATMCRQGDDAQTIATTSGRAIPDVEVAIMDASGQEVPRGESGEIMVRGYNLMRGYFEDEARTREAFNSEGWLHTGDIGVMDDQGNVRITDRKKDMFIVGGFNAYPAEIENLLLLHPDIVDVAVIGVPDERLGEVGEAYVVLRDGASFEPDALYAWSREKMANFKVPRRFHALDALPRNASGKVQKFKLREMLR